MHRYRLFLVLFISLAGATLGAAKPPSEAAIAKYTLILGNNRLARDPNDKKGKVLILFAAELEPNNQTVKNAVRALEQGVKLKPIPTRMTMDRLSGAMKQRVGGLLKQKGKTAHQRALLYLRVMEAFDPMNEKITYAIAGLEKKGIRGDLTALLGDRESASNDAPAVAVEDAPAEEKVAERPAEQAQGGYDEAGNPLPRPTTDYSKLKAPADWIKFAKARDQQDLNGEVAIIGKQYAKLCPAVNYKTNSGLQIRGVPPIVAAAQGTPDQILNMELDGRGTLNTLSPLFGMPLETLTITRPRGKTLDVAPLRASRLTILRIVRGEELKEIKNLEKIELLAIELNQCPKITDLDFLKGANIKALSAVDCMRLEDIDTLGDLKLTGLGFTNCPKITNLRPLKGTALEKVKLINCPNLRTIRPLEKLPITNLTVRNCEDLNDRDLIFSIKQLESLQHLDAEERIMQRVNLKK